MVPDLQASAKLASTGVFKEQLAYCLTPKRML